MLPRERLGTPVSVSFLENICSRFHENRYMDQCRVPDDFLVDFTVSMNDEIAHPNRRMAACPTADATSTLRLRTAHVGILAIPETREQLGTETGFARQIHMSIREDGQIGYEFGIPSGIKRANRFLNQRIGRIE